MSESESKPRQRSKDGPGARFPRNARITALVLAIGALLTAFYFAGRSGTDPNAYGNDFSVYYFAASEVTQGRDPYQNSLGAWTPYLYLPLLAELLVPLALFPLPVAAYIWSLISMGSFAATAWMSATLSNSSSRVLVAVLSAVVVIRFALDNFDYGQVNVIVAALAVAHIFLYERNRKGWSMVAFVLATSIKLTPAIFIFYHLAKRRFRFAAGCVAILIAVTALSFAPFGSSAPEAVQTFVQRTVKNGQGFDLAYSGNQSLRGVIARVRGDSETTARDPSDTMTMAGAVVMLALSAFVAFRSRNSNGALASFFCCIALLSPLAWKAHFVVLIFPAAFLISQLSRANLRRRFLSAATLIAAFALFNLTSPRIVGVSASEWVDQQSLVFMGAMLMYAASLVCSFESRANDKPSPVC